MKRRSRLSDERARALLGQLPVETTEKPDVTAQRKPKVDEDSKDKRKDKKEKSVMKREKRRADSDSEDSVEVVKSKKSKKARKEDKGRSESPEASPDLMDRVRAMLQRT